MIACSWSLVTPAATSAPTIEPADAGDLVKLVAAFFEDGDCARQRNSFDTAALQNEVRVQRLVHFCPS